MPTLGRLTMVLALSVLVGGVVGETQADDTKEVEGTFAGTFLGTRIDLFPTGNPDGFVAGWSTSAVKDDFGKSTIQAVVERVPTGPTPACPGGVFVIDAANGGFATFTQTFPNAEDQIYYQVLTSTFCSDGAGGFTGEDTGIIVGGAGEFAGVSGTTENTFSGLVQAFDPAAAQGFGSFTGEFESELNFP